MLTREELVGLYRKHRSERVLSIYLNADEHDPAKRRAWRRALDHVVADAQRGVGESVAERQAWDSALGHLKKELRRYDAFLPERGWAGFATPDAVLYAETLPVPMPDLARWEDGLRVAPYVRALKQAVPVITVLVDSRQARLYRYRQGAFEELPELRADMFFGDLRDVNMSKRATTHSGVRGETDTDAARRFEEVGSERLLKALTEAIREHAGAEGTVLVGGTTEMTAATVQRLPRTLNGRVTEDPSLSFYQSTAELKRAAETAASAMTERRQQRTLEQVIELAGAGGRGCLGRTGTDRALAERRVEVLLLSKHLRQKDPEYSDFCVGAAFEQDADVEELLAGAATKLDNAAEGIGARLRFTT